MTQQSLDGRVRKQFLRLMEGGNWKEGLSLYKELREQSEEVKKNADPLVNSALYPLFLNAYASGNEYKQKKLIKEHMPKEDVAYYRKAWIE